MSDTKNTTYGKPSIKGAVFVAPVGTELPKDALSEINQAFKGLGYISEDGMTNEYTPESENILAWGGDTVLNIQKSKKDTFTYKLIEAMNIDVLKQVYGDENVTGDLDSGIKITANSQELDAHSYVIDMIYKGGVLKRIVIPNGKISEVGEITYVDEDCVGYETTVTAMPDRDGNTHYEYIQKKAVLA